MFYYGSLKICCEKILESDQSRYNKISKNSELSAAFFKKKLWPKDSIITIKFLSSGDGIERTADFNDVNELDPLQKIVDNMPIKDAIKKIILDRLQPIVNLKFIFLDDSDKDPGMVRVNFDPNEGSWSLVGTDCLKEKDINKPTMNFGWFDVATVMHEFGHLCALIHEHQNPFGKPIDWDIPKVINWAKNTQGWDKKTTYTNIIDKYNKDELNGSEFDSKSIMLYFFPGLLTLNGKGTKQNLRLSGYDVLWLYKMYPINIKNLSDLSIPDNFYRKVYGISLEEAITGVKEKKWKKYLFYILVLLIISIIVWKIWKM